MSSSWHAYDGRASLAIDRSKHLLLLVHEINPVCYQKLLRQAYTV